MLPASITGLGHAVLPASITGLGRGRLTASITASKFAFLSCAFLVNVCAWCVCACVYMKKGVVYTLYFIPVEVHPVYLYSACVNVL